MISVSKSVLKSKMLEYFRIVEETGEGIVVTNHNIPTIRISSIVNKCEVDDIFKDVRGKVKTNVKALLQPEKDMWKGYL